jgi:hypothetical protein
VATIKFLTELFDAHAKDLQEFYSEGEDIFVCPICLTGFPREVISQRLVTDGHVWPSYVRRISEKARQMHVLLCGHCNHIAGTRGDAQMQIHERNRRRAETGNLDGRKVQFISNKDNSLINMNNVDITYNSQDESLTIVGRVSSNGKWRDASPEDQQKFIALYQNREPAKLVIQLPRKHKPELAQAGWITSAYLMGFYCLGYRFIFDSSLNLVRNYILNSFDKTIKQNPIQLNPDDFGIWEEDSNKSADPELLFMVPFEAGKRVYLQANCLRYRIRLPFRYQPSVLMPILQQALTDLHKSFQALREDRETIFFQVSSNKKDGNQSWYDQLLGTPHITDSV